MSTEKPLHSVLSTRRHFMSQSAAAATSASFMAFPLVAGAQPKTVKVGVLHPVTGALAYSGQQCREGALMAIEDIKRPVASSRSAADARALAELIGCQAVSCDAIKKEATYTGGTRARGQNDPQKCQNEHPRVFKRMLEPPFYAVKVTGALFHTQGGLDIDADCRVLRADGTAFPNLLAAGGAARGVSGNAVWGYLSGNGLLSAVAGGYIAAQTASQRVSGLAAHSFPASLA